MSAILLPGSDPPMITPYCRSCDLPVESFRMDVVTSPYYVGIHASCHGQSASARISVDEVFRIKRSNEKFFVVVPKGRFQTIEAQKNTGFGGVHG